MAKTKSKDVDTYSYKGWLISDNFFKRAFAIYGYCMIAGLLIMIPLYILMFALIVAAGVAGFFV